MLNEQFQKYNEGYNAGYMEAAQDVASAVLQLFRNHPSWMLEPDRKVAEASVKIETKRLLQNRKLVPYDYHVMRGLAEAVELDFNRIR